MPNPQEKPETSISGSLVPGHDLETKEAFEGCVLNPSRHPDDAAGFKTAVDGRYVLVPQPQDSPDGLLDWSPQKKLLILTIVGYIPALANYVGGIAIITVIPQSI